MFFVGITGGIATGKSTVTKIIAEAGLPIIDADTIARKVVEPGKKAWKKLKKEFGDEIFCGDGTLNRGKLGEIIFENVEKRKKLNLITHPEIIKEMVFSAVKLGLKGHPFVFLDIPLLYETGELVRLMHKIIVVNCPEELQLKRLMARNNLTDVGAKLRISSQMSLEEKCRRADYVIENSSVLEDTKNQVTRIVEDLKKSKFHYKISNFIFKRFHWEWSQNEKGEVKYDLLFAAREWKEIMVEIYPKNDNILNQSGKCLNLPCGVKNE